MNSSLSSTIGYIAFVNPGLDKISLTLPSLHFSFLVFLRIRPMRFESRPITTGQRHLNRPLRSTCTCTGETYRKRPILATPDFRARYSFKSASAKITWKSEEGMSKNRGGVGFPSLLALALTLFLADDRHPATFKPWCTLILGA